MTVLNTLRENLAGVFSDFWQMDQERPWSLEWAPILNQDAETGEYQICSTPAFADANDYAPQGAANAPFREIELRWTLDTIVTKRYVGKGFRLSDRQIRMLQTNPSLDPLKTAFRHLTADINLAHVNATVTAIGNLTATSAGSGTLACATRGTQIINFFELAKEEIYTDTGQEPNAVVLSKQAIRLIAAMDELQSTTSIAGVSDATARRTGTYDRRRVFDWFEGELGLRVIESKMISRSGTTNSLVSQTVGAIGYVAGGEEDAVMKTCSQTLERGADFIRLQTDEVGYPYPTGVGVGADAQYLVKTVSTKRGRKFTTSLT